MHVNLASLLTSAALIAAPVVVLAEPSPAYAAASDCAAFEIAAHRGYKPASVDGNSMQAFAAAAEAGYSIETDARADADGKIWMFHDRDTFASTGTPGFLDEMTSAEVEQLRYRRGQAPVVSLDDTLAFVAAQTATPLYVEPKVKTIAGEVTRKVLEAGIADRTWLTAFPAPVLAANPDAHQLEKLRGRQPSIDYLRSRGIDTVALLNRSLSPDVVDYYRANGFAVQAQEANGYRAWHQAIVAGADAQLTDNPLALENYCPIALEKPVITDVSPSRGRIGTEVTITGDYFFDVRAVRFASKRADFTVVNRSTVTAIVPADAYRISRLVVRTSNGATRSAETFEVTQARG